MNDISNSSIILDRELEHGRAMIHRPRASAKGAQIGRRANINEYPGEKNVPDPNCGWEANSG